MKRNRIALLDADHNLTISYSDIPICQEEEVLVQVKVNGICGSDIHFFKEGSLGNFIVTKPYVPGHEASGSIAEIGKKVKDFKVGNSIVIEPGIPCGRCTYCRSGRYNLCPDVIFLSAPPINGTFCDYIAVPYYTVHLVPENLSFKKAAFAEPTAVAIHAINRAGLVNGLTAVIVGAGPIGLLTLQVFKVAGGAKVICIDKLKSRLDLATKLGADEVILTEDVKDVRDIADVIFETAGNSKATQTLFNLLKPGGTAVQVGWPETKNVSLDVACFLDKEIKYVGVNRYANTFYTALAWLADNRIKVDDMITNIFKLDEIKEAFEITRDNPEKIIKTLVIN